MEIRLSQKNRIGTATANRGPKVEASPRPILASNVESLALNVAGQNWSGERVSPFPGGLGTCEGGLVLPDKENEGV